MTEYNILISGEVGNLEWLNYSQLTITLCVLADMGGLYRIEMVKARL